jgi:hypothetical protein
MLNKILDAIDSARLALSSESTLIRQGVSGLDLIDKELAARAVDYLVNGTAPQVLVDLRAKGCAAGIPLGRPGRLKWLASHTNLDDATITAAQNSLAARHKLYQRVRNDEASIAMLVRLGKVLEAADQGQQIDRTGASMPEWLQYLLNDALWASFPDHETAQKDAERPAWDITLVAALLAHDELPAAMTLPIVFERRGLDSYYHQQAYRRLLAAGPLDDYMTAHAADVDAAAAVLSAAGRALLVNRIGSNKALLNTFGKLMVRLAVGESRTVRATASRFIDGMEKASSTALLGELLRSGQTEERVNAADLLARIQGEAAMPVLETALAKESSKPVQQAIRSALSRLQAADDAGALELPEPPPLPPVPEQVLGDDALDLLLANRKELLERLHKGAEDEAESNRTAKYAVHYREKHYERYRQLSENQLRTALQALNGLGGERAMAVFGNQEVNETLAFGSRLESRMDFGLLQLLRWTTHLGHDGWSIWSHPRVQAWIRKQDKNSIDLRQLAALTAECGGEADAIPLACLRQSWISTQLPQTLLPAERVWPLFARFPELIDEGLGMAANLQRGRYGELDLGCTLAVLATFPVIPARWLPRIMELALGDGKTHRAAAQQVLARLPDIGKRVCDALQSTRQELRIEAARWLGKLDYRAGIPALHAALAKETRETASAALMTALENLGEDMSAHLAPARLLAQARKGLKGKPPAGMAWLNLDSAPPCHWLDGNAVEPEIVRWWVVLACKLKEPGGNALFERYLGLLARADRATLGAWLLHQFIACDTAHPPLEEGIAWAQAHAAPRYQQYQSWAQKYPQYYEAQGKLTQEQVFELLKREKMSEYLGTAINEKGLLALISGMPGHEMVSAIQLYMRDHYPRRAQIEALLEAACVSNEASVIQFTLGIARRYRTASVQEKARLLVQRIAERNGWTQDQLADRTVPTGGLDETGRLTLQYGGRQYTVVLDAAMKPTLRNEDGKPVSALPAPRQDDAPEGIKEAKQQFATCKKELKQVIEMQTGRLYEAMCAGRRWPAGEWREYLQQHPIVGRLVQRLVWLESTGDDATARLFRPTEDGSLVDASDDEVVLADSAEIRLAHGSILAAEQAAAWLAHFKDYKLTPLFAQMTRKRPILSERSDSDAIADRLGWVSDAYTLRGAFNKLGYQRGHAEDGGFFYEYKKDYASASLSVIMEFSGNALPEENLPAALKTLTFRSMDGQRYGYVPVALDKVPPVLLAEAYGDYHAVAAACAGYDPDWEKKLAW